MGAAMALDPAERKARHKARVNQYRRDMRAALKALAGPKPAPVGPRMTMNPARAHVVRDPETGRTYPRHTEVFQRCVRLMTL